MLLVMRCNLHLSIIYEQGTKHNVVGNSQLAYRPIRSPHSHNLNLLRLTLRSESWIGLSHAGTNVRRLRVGCFQVMIHWQLWQVTTTKTAPHGRVLLVSVEAKELARVIGEE